MIISRDDSPLIQSKTVHCLTGSHNFYFWGEKGGFTTSIIASTIFLGNRAALAVSTVNSVRRTLTPPLSISHRLNPLLCKTPASKAWKVDAPEVSSTDFLCWLNALVFGTDSSKLSHPPKIALWTVMVLSGWLQLLCTVRRSISSWAGNRNMGLLKDSEKRWGTILSLVAPRWTCLTAIRSCSRNTWEWVFTETGSPLERSTNMGMCADSFLTCWPCAWEPDLFLYISKFLKSLGNNYSLPVKPRVAHAPVTTVLPTPGPASWHVAEASSREYGQPSPPACWVTQGPVLSTSPAFTLVSFRLAPPVLFLLLQLIFISACQLLTSLLKWHIFSLILSLLKFSLLFLRFLFQPSGSMNLLQPVL